MENTETASKINTLEWDQANAGTQSGFTSDGSLHTESDMRQGASMYSTEMPQHRIADITTDMFHDVEQIMVQHPWPVILTGFAAGYLLFRTQAR